MSCSACVGGAIVLAEGKTVSLRTQSFVAVSDALRVTRPGSAEISGGTNNCETMHKQTTALVKADTKTISSQETKDASWRAAHQLGLPPSLAAELAFRGPGARLCPLSWASLLRPRQHAHRLEACPCPDCVATGGMRFSE